jgi:hypothetical protein
MNTAERFEQDKKWFWEEQRKIQERSQKAQQQKQQIPEVKIVKK